MLENKNIKLAEEAVMLIKEFMEKVMPIYNEEILINVEMNVDEYDEMIISIDERYDGKKDYMLFEISEAFDYYYSSEYTSSERLEEAFSLKMNELNMKKMERNEYLKAMGDLCYSELRCHEIYDRLKEIEHESK